MGNEILPGDIVAVNVPGSGKQEGLVLGSHYDHTGRQIVEIRFDKQPDVYYAPYPLVTYVRRNYNNNYHQQYVVPGRRTVERHVHYY